MSDLGKLSRRTLLGAGLLAVHAMAGACTAPPIRIVDPPQADSQPPPPPRWTFTAPGAVLSMAVADDVAFVADDGGFVHAVSMDDGALRWSQGGVVPRQMLTVTRSTLVSASGQVTRGLDPVNGETRWSITGQMVASRPDVVLSLDVVPEVGPQLMAVDPDDGAVRWRRMAEEVGVLSPYGSAIAVFSGDVVYLGPGAFAALDLSTGSELWRNPLEHSYPGSTTMAASKTALHVVHTSAPRESVILAMDLRTGADHWHGIIPESHVASLSAYGEALLVMSQSAIASWDCATGERRWIWSDTGDPEHGISGDKVYPIGTAVAVGNSIFFVGAGVDDGKLVALDAATGQPRWRLTLRSPESPARAPQTAFTSADHPIGPVHGGSLVLAAQSATVFAVSATG